MARADPGGRTGGGILASDVLTPAAAFLGISVSTLASDLAGGKTLAQEATAKGKTASDLITAIVAAEKTNLDNEKAAGWITADQETNLVSSLTAEVTALVNNGPPVPPSGDKGAGGPLQTAATFLGLSVSDLQTALKGGKTLADEATAQGKNVNDLITALEAPGKEEPRRGRDRREDHAGTGEHDPGQPDDPTHEPGQRHEADERADELGQEGADQVLDAEEVRQAALGRSFTARRQYVFPSHRGRAERPASVVSGRVATR